MTGRSSTWSWEIELRLEVVRTDEWAEVVATRWLDRQRQRPHSRLCLPTGSTPRPMYRRFAELGGDLSQSSVFLLDEFGLEPESESRCGAMIRRDLLDLLPGAPRSFHALDVDAHDLKEECHRYEALVRTGGLDIAMLGLGANGHLGLNEPGSLETSTTRVVQLTPETGEHAQTYGSNVAATWGMTLGIDTLLTATEIWLLVTGEHKAKILARAVNDAGGPNVPATYLRNHSNVILFADEPAAAML